MVSPFYLVVILPVSFLQSPDIELTPRLALVPVINVALMFRDAIGGVYRWPLVLLTIAVEALTIVACLALARAILRFEEVMMGSFSGSVFKFARERLLSRRGSGGAE
jgi:sodium transport system permease protein